MSITKTLITFLFFTSLAHANNYKEIKLTDFPSGDIFSLSTLDEQKPTYIKMWATWCKPCMEQMPHFQKLYEKFGDKVNFLAVDININEENEQIAKVIKQFGLTMPVLLDNEGQLGVALGLVGTPYSVLINTDDNIVYTTHESDKNLDKFIEKLANGEKLASSSDKSITELAKQQLIEPWRQGEHLLFFTATWCDWYLADSRPDMAKTCAQVQLQLNDIYSLTKEKPWHGFVNHLWTDEKALTDFTKQYDMKIKFDIDAYGVLFNHFTIRTIPTIIKIKDGKVIERITTFDDIDEVIKTL